MLYVVVFFRKNFLFCCCEVHSSHSSEMHASNNKARYEQLIVQMTCKMPVWLGHWKMNYDARAADVDLFCPKDFGMEFLKNFFNGYDITAASVAWKVTRTTPLFREMFETLKSTHFLVDVVGCLESETCLSVQDKDVITTPNESVSFDDDVAQKMKIFFAQYEDLISKDHQIFCSSVEEELVQAINEISESIRSVNEQHLELLKRLDQFVEDFQSKKRRRSAGDQSIRLNSLKLQKTQVY